MRAPLPPLDPAYDKDGNHYWRYHGLDALLACKRPVTASVDEDLFITVHQVCELNFHQIILDLDRALDEFGAALEVDPVIGDTAELRYFLTRALRLWDVVIRTTPVLMTLRGFSEFRTALGPSSGFQSAQFRHVEIQSGVDRPFWRGGTNDAAGNTHPAETAFDARYGEQIRGWFERYARHNLKHYYEVLVKRGAGDMQPKGGASPGGRGRAARIAALREHPHAGPLLAQLRAYDLAQRRFHEVHLQLAVQQLALVGVEVGTGGTTFKKYLGTYGREVAPLFPGLGRAKAG